MANFSISNILISGRKAVFVSNWKKKNSVKNKMLSSTRRKLTINFAIKIILYDKLLSRMFVKSELKRCRKLYLSCLWFAMTLIWCNGIWKWLSTYLLQLRYQTDLPLWRYNDFLIGGCVDMQYKLKGRNWWHLMMADTCIDRRYSPAKKEFLSNRWHSLLLQPRSKIRCRVNSNRH